MSTRIKSLIRWAPIIILVVCSLVFQGTSGNGGGKTRLRHSHRKLRCSKCPPGWGVAHACSATQDTQCVRCAHGRYSPHHSFNNPCWLCSRCGVGLYEAHPCHPGGDTVCDNCLRPRSDLRNLARDFFKKCAPPEDVAVVDEWESALHHDDTNRLLLKK